jgi:perosamine synthetase
MTRIPLSSPDIGPEEIAAVLEVLKSPRLSWGPRLVEFETAFARYVGAAFAVGVSSGTAALHLSLLAGGIGEGDLVVTTPLSFVSSANAMLYVGARPVFLDVESSTGNLDPLLEIAREHDLLLIEDACEALGSEYRGRRVGSFGHASAFGFYPNKQLTTGEGGMVVTSDPEWAALFESLRNQGRGVGPLESVSVHLGYNYRLNELSAALGLIQLQRLDELLEKRAQVAAWYRLRLEGVPGIGHPAVLPETTRMSWFLFRVILSGPVERRRVELALAERGIPSRGYFTPIHLQPYYRDRFGFKEGAFPVAERLGGTSLALPFSSIMTEEQVETVCRELRRVMENESLHIRG